MPDAVGQPSTPIRCATVAQSNEQRGQITRRSMAAPLDSAVGKVAASQDLARESLKRLTEGMATGKFSCVQSRSATFILACLCQHVLCWLLELLLTLL